MKKVVEHKQSLLDIALQHSGNIDSLFELAALNNLSITDDLNYGSSLEVGGSVNNDVVETYLDKSIIPATDIDNSQPLLLEGIGYWIVGTDFKVS